MFLISVEGDIGFARNQLLPLLLLAFSVMCPAVDANPKPAQMLHFPLWSLLFALPYFHSPSITATSIQMLD